jgi:hypothetical protein
MNVGPSHASLAPKIARRTLLATLMATCALLVCALSAAPAMAGFGLKEFDVAFTNQDGTPATQAGSHPYAMTTSFAVNTTGGPLFNLFVEGGDIKDALFQQVEGLAGNSTAMPRCSTIDFLSAPESQPQCDDSTAVGAVAVRVSFLTPFPVWANAPIYNLETSPGVPARLGFNILNVPLTIDVGVKDRPRYNLTASLRNTPQPLTVYASKFQLWGNPTDSSHDPLRGNCLNPPSVGLEFNFAVAAEGSCPAVGASGKAFLTLPTNCAGPEESTYQVASWLEPENWVSGGVLSHDNAEPPNPQGFTGCGKLGFAPNIESRATTDEVESGTGFDFALDFDDEGLTNPVGYAESQTRKAVVTLPEAVTINPSVGEGLGVCRPVDLERETLGSSPGDGCPNSSKIGTLAVESPIAEEGIGGSVFLAQQDDPATAQPGAENPFDSLIALYLVLKNTNLGVLVKLPLKVEPDARTGQLVATMDDIPQLPFSHFAFHFREGQRAPLISPPTCGTYTTEASLYPWSDPTNPRLVTSSFEISQGIGGGPCPPGGVPPFAPDFEAGSLNNNAKSFSPFTMRLLRADGEQDLTRFSSVLPPGVLGKLAGIEKCSDAAVEASKAKTGRQELASPSCPASSQIGRTLAGAGVGGALTYVPGAIHLGGPYRGAPLSVIAITPAVAGPFDAGTVVTRLGLDLNPETAEVEVDGEASDPIPHILQGIPLKVRDLRVSVDRDRFILNPTSCDESSARATLFGSFLDVFSPADDVGVDLSTRYQAANCLNLGFEPKLGLRLRGGTSRGGHPGLTATYRPRPGDANVEDVVVRLPRSVFLDQAHIRTVCTRVQFAAGSCPQAARYGYVKAWTPLLDEPLEGPVYLRSSNHELPDMVFDLRGLVDVEVTTRIDSLRGRLRAVVEDSPDAPISKVVLRMQGQRKGLIVNSRNLCGQTNRASLAFSGHNGKRHVARPPLKRDCRLGSR